MKGAARQRWLEQMRFWRSLEQQFDRFAAEYQRNRRCYQKIARLRKPPRPVHDHDWEEPMQLDERRERIPNEYNAFLVMTECPALSGIVGYDLALHRIMLKAPLPGDWRPAFEMRPFTRDDLIELLVYVQGIGFPAMTRQTLYWGVRRAARFNEWRVPP
jgi:hypothetical protein